MSKIKNILIIGDYFRNDIVSMFDLVHEKVNVYFLYFNSKKTEPNKRKLINDDNTLYWNHYKDGYKLLVDTNISKLYFTVFETYKEVALNTAAKQMGLSTFFVEHGIKSYNYKLLIKKPNLLNKIVINILQYKNRFYKRTLSKTKGKNSLVLKSFFYLRFMYPINDAISFCSNDILPEYLLVFAKKNYEFYKKRGDTYKEVKYFGIPYFDEYANIKQEGVDNDYILIEQHFLEQKQFRIDFEKWQNHINDILRNIDKTVLFIKPHPLGKNDKWKIFGNKIILLNNKGFADKIMKKNIIIGYWSTLLIPLIAIKHLRVNLIADFPKINYSRVFDGINNIRFINNIEEYKLISKENESLDNNNFILNWMYKFDGKSKARLTKIIIDEFN